MNNAEIEELRKRQCFGKPGSYYVEVEDFEREALFAYIDELTAMLRKIAPEWYREYAGPASVAEDYATIQRLTATADTHSAERTHP